MKKIYIDVKGKKKLIDFIEECFNTNNVYGIKYCKQTYKDINLINKEFKSARRSFEDLRDIIKTNFRNNISDKTIAKTLYQLYLDGKMCSLYCPDASKLVFFNCKYEPNRYKMIYNTLLPPNEDISEKGKSEYSLKDILDLAGFKDRYKVNE